MFTGLVEDVGTIAGTARRRGGVSLSIACGLPLHEIATGDSIAVDGVCLTVTEITGNGFMVDVSPETARRSTLGNKPGGSTVNLERALRLTDRLGGHFVTGHIDGTGRLTMRKDAGDFTRMVYTAEAAILQYIVEKGSIAVDGVSLTVNEVSADSFAVTVIPHTLAATTLGGRNEGDAVNIENDLLGKYVEKFLGRQGRKPHEITRDFLEKYNFI